MMNTWRVVKETWGNSLTSAYLQGLLLIASFRGTKAQFRQRHLLLFCSLSTWTSINTQYWPLPQKVKISYCLIHWTCWIFVSRALMSWPPKLKYHSYSAVSVCVCVCVCLQSHDSIHRKAIRSHLVNAHLALCSISRNNWPHLCYAKTQSMIYATVKSRSTLPFSASCPLRLLGKYGDKLGTAK